MILGVFLFSKKNSNVKNTAVKKEEIIAQYETKLLTLLKQHKNDKTKQIEQKKIFMQHCNSELSRNIFFTREESVKILQKLSLL